MICTSPAGSRYLLRLYVLFVISIPVPLMFSCWSLLSCCQFNKSTTIIFFKVYLDIKIVSSISTFVLNTLTLNLSAFFQGVCAFILFMLVLLQFIISSIRCLCSKQQNPWLLNALFDFRHGMYC